MEKDVRKKYEDITNALIKKNLLITTMESCTSGLIASLLTDTEGASAIFKGSFVTYSNEAKVKAGVPSEIIDTCGVYSKETAAAMAESALSHFNAHIGVGITGTFGNIDPNNNDSTPGEVFYAITTQNKTRSFRAQIPPKGSRYDYKLAAADEIADNLLAIIGQM